MIKEFEIENKQGCTSSRRGGEQALLDEMLFSFVDTMECEEEAKKNDKDEANQEKERNLNAGRCVIENATATESYSNSHQMDVNNENSEITLQGRKRRLDWSQSQPHFQDGFAAFRASIREEELAKKELEEQRLEYEQHHNADVLCEQEPERKAHVVENA